MTQRTVAAFYACVQDEMQKQAAWLPIETNNPLMWFAEICSHMGRIATRVIASTGGHTSGIRDAIIETAALIIGFNEWLKPRSYAARGLEIDWTSINEDTSINSANPLDDYTRIVEYVGKFAATSNVRFLAAAYAWCATMWEKIKQQSQSCAS